MKGEKSRNRKEEWKEKLKEEIKAEIEEEGIQKASEIMEKYRSRYLEEVKQFNIKDPEQSWKPFKGNLLEEIIMEYIQACVIEVGLQIVRGSVLEREDTNLDSCLVKVKRNLVVDFGKYGMHLPDADLVIYDPHECKPFAIISSKTTLRERVAQTGYWSLKLKKSETTKNIYVFLITLDEDGDFRHKTPAKKGRAIAERDIDRTYVITNVQNGLIEESSRVKTIDKFGDDIRTLFRKRKPRKRKQ